MKRQDARAQGELFDEETRYKVNPFDWEVEFPEILRTPTQSPPIGGDVRRTEGIQGFDVVIGNPPWIDIKGLEPVQVDYYLI